RRMRYAQMIGGGEKLSRILQADAWLQRQEIHHEGNERRQPERDLVARSKEGILPHRRQRLNGRVSCLGCCVAHRCPASWVRCETHSGRLSPKPSRVLRE